MHTYRSRIENGIFQAVLEQQDEFFDMDRFLTENKSYSLKNRRSRRISNKYNKGGKKRRRKKSTFRIRN